MSDKHTHSPRHPLLRPQELGPRDHSRPVTAAVVGAQVRTPKSRAVSKFKYEGLFQDNPRSV